MLFAILLMSCNNQNDDLLKSIENDHLNRSYLVPESQAIEEAISFFNAQKKDSPNKRPSYVKRCVQASSNSGSVSAREGVYIINFENNNGFAVVSADKRDGASVYFASPVGFCDETNDVYKDLLNRVKEYQQTVISSHSFNPDKGDAIYTETTTVEENYGPLLSTCWHQRGVFNQELKRIYGEEVDSAMGCMPVAIGQIINYFQFPDTIRGECIYWDFISLATGRESIPTLATNTASRMLYLLGLDMGLNYPSYSSAIYPQAVAEFRLLGYLFSEHAGFDVNIVKNQISQQKPVFISGDNGNEGHAWIADGFMRVKTEYRVYDENGNLVENTVLNDYNYDNTNDYIHLNPGWGANYLTYKNSRFEYESNIDHRIWVYSNIFNFVPGNSSYSFNNNVRLIYNFSHQ